MNSWGDQRKSAGHTSLNLKGDDSKYTFESSPEDRRKSAGHMFVNGLGNVSSIDNEMMPRVRTATALETLRSPQDGGTFQRLRYVTNSFTGLLTTTCAREADPLSAYGDISSKTSAESKQKTEQESFGKNGQKTKSLVKSRKNEHSGRAPQQICNGYVTTAVPVCKGADPGGGSSHAGVAPESCAVVIENSWVYTHGSLREGPLSRY